MIRNEEINKAAYSQYCNSESICFTLMCDSFKQGAKWADEHPQSPWISVKDDLPCNHEELWVMAGSLIHTKKVLVSLTDDTNRLLSMLYDEVNDEWDWESKIIKSKIIFWTPIPELPKE